MSTRLALAAGLLGLLLAGPTRGADGLAVTGTVKDAAGNPVAGADLASLWMSQGEDMTAYEGVKTDAQGKFSIKVNHFGRPVAVMVIDKERKSGGIFSVDKDTAAKPAAVSLVPL